MPDHDEASTAPFPVAIYFLNNIYVATNKISVLFYFTRLKLEEQYKIVSGGN